MQRKVEKVKAQEPQTEYYSKFDLEIDLSFNTDYTVLTSVRNIGKSYSAMQYALSLIEQGKTVLWERYTKDEFAMSVRAWENFAPDLKNIKGKIKNLIDEESGGELIIIQTSVANNIKGYDNSLEKLPVLEVKDEFLPVRYTNNTRFINEFTEAMEIRKTFKRNGNMRSLYLGNNLNWLNPYTIGWNMPLVQNGERIKVTDTFNINKEDVDISAQRTILWHSIKPTQKMLTRIFGHEIASLNKTDLNEYFDNGFYKEYDAFGKCPDMRTPLAPYEIMSQGYYIGIRIYDGKMYMCKVNHNANAEVYVSEPEYIDYENNHIRMKSVGREFENRFDGGLCIFDNMNTYYAFFRWIVNIRKRL